MGTYTRKSKGIGELSVMEVAHVGVRTRARALAMAAAANSRTMKRRKVSSGALRFSSSLAQLRSRRRMVIMRENSISPATSGSSEQTVSNDRRSSHNSDNIFASYCSSNASSDLAKERFNIVDLEDESAQNDQSACDFDCRQRRETTPSSGLQTESGDLESTARPASEANSRRRSSAGNTPSEAELEEFFATAEKDLQKRFTEKYNYDIVKDVPLEGRHEWIQLKP